MSNHKYREMIVICRVVAALSLVAVLATMIIAVNIDSWNDTISTALRVLSRVSWGCFLVSLIGIAALRQKSKEQKTDVKIKELEQEIERLKKK